MYMYLCFWCTWNDFLAEIWLTKAYVMFNGVACAITLSQLLIMRYITLGA